MQESEVKRQLTNELGSVLKAAISGVSQQDTDFLPSDATQAICNVVEAMFIHGLRDPFFVKGSRYAKYPEPNFWPFISKFTHRSIRAQISNLKQIRSEVGRARAWVRIVLNEGVIEHYVTALSRDAAAVRQFYHRYAYLRDAEQVDIMISYLKGLARAKMNAPVNSSFLNGWTPTPLILAGLINGEANKLSQRRRGGSGNNAAVVEMDDIPEDDIPVGMSALEFEGLEGGTSASSSPVARSPLMTHLQGRYTPKGLFSSEDDDGSSVYSHPSMMDSGRFQESLRYSRQSNGGGSQTSSGAPNHTADEPEGFSDSGIASDVGQVIVHRNVRANTSRSSPSGSLSALPVITASVDFACQTVAETGIQTDDSLLLSHTDVGTSNADFVPLPPLLKDESGDLVLKNAVGISAEENNATEENAEAVTERTTTLPCIEIFDATATTERKSPAKEEEESSKRSFAASSPIFTREAFADDGDSIPIAIARMPELNAGEARSLGDELATALQNECFSPPGNSLLGKGWGSHEVEEEDRLRFSSTATDDTEADTSDSAPENFDAVLRTALNYRLGLDCDFAPETVVRNRLDSGRFADTVNDDKSGVIEVARASIDERADVASLAAARTVLPPDNPAHRRGGKSHSQAQRVVDLDEYVVIDSSTVSGMDECGISSERIPLLTSITPEEGLDRQNYQCPACRRSIGLIYGPSKLCWFDGKQYCPDCQRRDEMIVPARLIHSWDVTPRPVSRPSKSFVDHVADRPLIRIDQVNPAIYEAISEMTTVHMLREKLSLVAMYLLTCKESVADDLRRRVWPKEYLYNDIHLYSVNDLINSSTGVLQKHLQSVISYAVKHVEQCRLCVQKGFICEICSHPQIIYPFQVETTFRCIKCFSVFHQECINGRPCPKCVRREQYNKERKNNATDQLLNTLMMDEA